MVLNSFIYHYRIRDFINQINLTEEMHSFLRRFIRSNPTAEFNQIWEEIPLEKQATLNLIAEELEEIFWFMEE